MAVSRTTVLPETPNAGLLGTFSISAGINPGRPSGALEIYTGYDLSAASVRIQFFGRTSQYNGRDGQVTARRYRQ